MVHSQNVQLTFEQGGDRCTKPYTVLQNVTTYSLLLTGSLADHINS